MEIQMPYKVRSINYETGIIYLKKAIWLYFLLIIFEGALRKWFLPGLATPLLLARDPVAVWILFQAGRKGFFPFNIFVFVMVSIGIISFLATLVVGHGNIFAALFGLRILIVHFPLMVVIGRVFNRDDVIKVGEVILYLTPFMAFLIAVQFYSPQSAWVNRGIGGDTEGGGFSAIPDYFRPPGTFSFTNGVTLFFSLAAPFIFYFWLNRHHVKKWLLLAATIGLLAAIPLAVSRGLLFSVIISFGFMVIAGLYQPRYLGATIVSAIAGIIILGFLGATSFFETATKVFTARFEMANEQEGGLSGVLGDRYLGGMIGALTYDAVKLPLFGHGIGMGTNVGAMLLSGKMTFLISEGEWGRLIGESGPILGILAILNRLGFVMALCIASFRKLSKGDLLPWLLLSYTLIVIPQGQWAQPTALGFSTLIGGLLIASFRTSK